MVSLSLLAGKVCLHPPSKVSFSPKEVVEMTEKLTDGHGTPNTSQTYLSDGFRSLFHPLPVLLINLE